MYPTTTAAPSPNMTPAGRGLARRGVSVRIIGPCQSACTVLLGHIPHNKICVTAEASFGFHLAHSQQATATLWNAYSPGIKA